MPFFGRKNAAQGVADSGKGHFSEMIRFPDRKTKKHFDFLFCYSMM